PSSDRRNRSVSKTVTRVKGRGSKTSGFSRRKAGSRDYGTVRPQQCTRNAPGRRGNGGRMPGSGRLRDGADGARVLQLERRSRGGGRDQRLGGLEGVFCRDSDSS